MIEEQMKVPANITAAILDYIDGHVNETVEQWNFRRCRQQAGGPFNDSLIALCKLNKACKFCLNTCAQKSLGDQIIEGLQEADIIEYLLKEKDLSLESTIMSCCSYEAAKKHCLDITQVE